MSRPATAHPVLSSKLQTQSETKVRPLAVSIKTAAQMFEVSEKTVRRLIEKGGLKPIRIMRSLRISIAQLKALLAGETPGS